MSHRFLQTRGWDRQGFEEMSTKCQSEKFVAGDEVEGWGKRGVRWAPVIIEKKQVWTRQRTRNLLSHWGNKMINSTASLNVNSRLEKYTNGGSLWIIPAVGFGGFLCMHFKGSMHQFIFKIIVRGRYYLNGKSGELFPFWRNVQSVDFGKCYSIIGETLGRHDINGVGEARVKYLSKLVHALYAMYKIVGGPNLGEDKTILVNSVRNKCQNYAWIVEVCGIIE